MEWENYNPEHNPNETNTFESDSIKKRKLNFSTVFGLFFLLFALVTFIWPVFGVPGFLAVCYGIYGLYRIRKTNEKGKILAIITIILGVLISVPNILLSVRSWL